MLRNVYLSMCLMKWKAVLNLHNLKKFIGTTSSYNGFIERGRLWITWGLSNITDETDEFSDWTYVEGRDLGFFNHVQVEPTRSACRRMMKILGIKDNADALLVRMVLRRLARFDFDIYVVPTLHFLAKVVVKIKDGIERVHFKVGVRSYSLTFQRFCEVYEFPTLPFEDTQWSFTEMDRLWPMIAINEWYSAHSARVSKVRNPTIWYALRLIVNTIFAREEPATSSPL